MKAEELMIGDWVSTQRFRQGIPCVDATVQVNADMLFNLSIDMDVAEPIPITEYILKANGFEVHNDKVVGLPWNCTHWSLLYDGLYIHYYTSQEIDVVEKTGDYYEKVLHAKNITCVHQLQHALHLCELNELADNFKIE